MLNTHARNLTVCTWLKDILKSNWCQVILVKGNCTFNYRRGRKYWTWKLRASQILICLCVCVYPHICVCIVCVSKWTHTHTPFSKVIWYNLENKIFLTGLFLNTASPTSVCPSYALYCVCKEMYPYGNLQEQPNFVRNKDGFSGPTHWK